MAYQDCFDSWRRGEVALRGYFRPPEELTLEDIPAHDRSAAHLLSQAQALIQDLTEYRQALAARYAALAAMPYQLRLTLVRHPPWSGGGVSFDLRLTRHYEDGTETDELREHYTGKDRREAIARYEELRKARPGIETAKDIARRPWER